MRRRLCARAGAGGPGSGTCHSRGPSRAQAHEKAGLRRRGGQARGRAEAEAEDALVVDSEDEATAAGDEDETFLEEEEEDGSDMSNIIGGPVAEPEEPQ